MSHQNDEARPVARSGFKTAQTSERDQKSSTAAAAVEARLARERTLDRHLAAVREAEVRRDRRRALGHLLAAVGLVLTRDHPVAGHAARVALGAGRRA